MRTAVVAMAMIVLGVSCASAPTSGPLGEGSAVHPRIAAVDSAIPPRHATVQLDQREYLALLLIAPGHSATLLYPNDSATRNQFAAGFHQIAFQIPELLVATDSARLEARIRDTTRISRARPASARSITPLPPTTPTFLLVVTSPQQLHYSLILEKTAGVSIPNIDSEALNAVGKAIKSTIANEPREWAGYYQQVEVRRQR